MPEHGHVIWEGRFQPIHRGHVAYVERLLEHGDHVWVFVVANETSAAAGLRLADLPVPEFTEVVDHHHGREKNPLPYWFRYLAVVETLANELPHAPVTVWGGRRLDLQWSLYEKLLPRPRMFLTPERDAFEDAKARAWQQLGERVVRIPVDDLPSISGTAVREALRAGRPLEGVLCPRTLQLLSEYGFLDCLRAAPSDDT